MNHVAAPVVRALLRSPLHGLLSDSVMLVTYQGRRSGRAFALPVQYVRDEDAFVVTVGAPGAKQWWRNFTEPRPAELLVR
ncbi:MAG: nitroreductase/quinone reductase family protein, partial [Acidimicrobiales bacterium]